MGQQGVMDFAREALLTVILSAGPLLMVALIVGLLVSIFQTITSIQDQTLSFVPKILAVFLALIVFGNFIGATVLDFFTTTMESMQQFIR